MISAEQYVKNLFNQGSERDRQRMIGASNMSSACTRCLADDMLQVTRPQGVYDMGKEVGTAIHSYLEDRNRDWYALPERKVVIGTIEGYGEISSTTDLVRIDPDTGGVHIVDFKGLALDTPLPTPKGWTTMGAVQVGDYLLDEQGKRTRVIGKSDVKNLPNYRLTFDDTSEIICDKDHLWSGVIGFDELEEVVISAGVLYEQMQGKTRFRVPIAKPLELPEQDLPIDPYILGVWLGDGTVGKSEVTLNKQSKAGIVPEMRRRGQVVTERQFPSDIAKGSLGVRYSLVPPEEWGKRPVMSSMSQKLRDLGVLNNKHIPMQYLRASHQQRLDLLRGLMDTDGYYNAERKMVALNTTDRAWADDVCELINTFGWRAHVMSANATWTHKGVKKNTEQYMLSFKPDVSPFFARNAEEDYAGQFTIQSSRRLLKSIEPIGVRETQCVMVDSPSRLYLCGTHMVPTHNTTTRDKLSWYRAVVQQDPEFDSPLQAKARWTLSQYFRQAQLYALGVHNTLHMEPAQVDIVFVCRDGQIVDRDIWGHSMPYDPALAETTFNRAAKLWEWLQTPGNDPDDLPSQEHCYYCSVVRSDNTPEVEL